jgi:hypothetical protein
MVNPQQSDYAQQPTYAMLPPESTGASSGTATDDGDYSGGGGFEVSLASSRAAPIDANSIGYKILSAVIPPPDMEHQCRAVADWLNFKVLQAGLKSKSPNGLMAAAAQWRRHSRAFLSHSQQWYQWSYVAHQRLVMSQLVERHPPDSGLSDEPDNKKDGGGGGGEHQEFLLQCSPWRSYEAATEAMLRLGLELHKVQQRQQQQAEQPQQQQQVAASFHDDHMKRARYVGGLDREGLGPKLKQELQVHHRGMSVFAPGFGFL